MFSVVRLPLKGLWKGLVFEGFVQNVLRRAVRIGVPQTIIDSTLHIDIHSIYIYTYTHVYIYIPMYMQTHAHTSLSLYLSLSLSWFSVRFVRACWFVMLSCVAPKFNQAVCSLVIGFLTFEYVTRHGCSLTWDEQGIRMDNPFPAVDDTARH